MTQTRPHPTGPPDDDTTAGPVGRRTTPGDSAPGARTGWVKAGAGMVTGSVVGVAVDLVSNVGQILTLPLLPLVAALGGVVVCVAVCVLVASGAVAGRPQYVALAAMIVGSAVTAVSVFQYLQPPPSDVPGPARPTGAATTPALTPGTPGASTPAVTSAPTGPATVAPGAPAAASTPSASTRSTPGATDAGPAWRRQGAREFPLELSQVDHFPQGAVVLAAPTVGPGPDYWTGDVSVECGTPGTDRSEFNCVGGDPRRYTVVAIEGRAETTAVDGDALADPARCDETRGARYTKAQVTLVAGRTYCLRPTGDQNRLVTMQARLPAGSSRPITVTLVTVTWTR